MVTLLKVIVYGLFLKSVDKRLPECVCTLKWMALHLYKNTGNLVLEDLTLDLSAKLIITRAANGHD